MRNFTETAISGIDRLARKVGPLSQLLDTLIERVVPQTTGQACTGVPCYSQCGGPCDRYGDKWYYLYYADTVYDCQIGNWTCVDTSCSC